MICIAICIVLVCLCEKFLIKIRVSCLYMRVKNVRNVDHVRKRITCCLTRCIENRIEKSIAERHFLKRCPPEVRPLLSRTKTNRVRGETRYTIIATFRRASNGVDLTEFLTILD